MFSSKDRPMIIVHCLVIVLFSRYAHRPVGAQSILTPPGLNIDQLNSAYPEQTQHRQQALTDHTNDAIFNSSSQEIIERSGFEQVTHLVTSADGYITELINVINPLADRTKLKQPPVMLFHGGLVDTSAWLWGSAIQHHPEKYPRTADDGPITSSNRSLGMMLTNYGYDVWLVATRGSNRRNIGHTTLQTKLLEDVLLDPTNPKAQRHILDTLRYFDYSQDELVELEFPAQIERVLNLTGSSKVSTITYSFSTHIMFKLLASNKELSKKIYTNCALQPLLNRNGMSTIFNMLLGINLLLPDKISNFLMQLVFGRMAHSLLRILDRYTTALYVVSIGVGASPRYQTFLEAPVIGHAFLPTSMKESKHYAQQTLVGKLQKFDHGPVRNLQLYKQPTPPVYSIKDIQIKRWMLVTGDTDVPGTINSADTYASQLPNKPYRYIRQTGGWSHLDTVAAFDVDVVVNLPIVDFLGHFSSTNASEIDAAD